MSFLTLTEARTWVSNTLTTETAVTADVTILSITTIIENSDVSFISLQTSFSAAGKLYVVDENDNPMYLTDSSTDYPANMQIISTFMLPKGKTVSLKYSNTCTMSSLIIVHGGGVF